MPGPARIATVLFDLDDTLLETFRLREAALQSAFDAAGIASPRAGEFITGMAGRQLQETLDDLQRTAGSRYDLFGHYRRAYWLTDGKAAVLPGVWEMVQGLHRKGARMGVVTQKERRFRVDGRWAGVQRELEETGLAPFIEVTVGFEDVTRHKPHPEAVLLALRALGGKAQETLFVGDSASDMKAALAAGVWTCHAAWGLPPGHAGLDGATPHMVVQRPQELLGLPFV